MVRTGAALGTEQFTSGGGGLACPGRLAHPRMKGVPVVTRGNNRARRALAIVAGFGLVAGAVVPASASGSSESGSKISPQVQEQLQADGSADVWLHFSDRADLSAASSMSWSDRGRFVHEALTASADASQAEVKAQLDAAGVEYESFFIVNAIKVNAADAALVKSLAANAGIDAISPEFEVTNMEPVAKAPSTPAPQAVEWGVENINAPAVWEQYGTGEGITVATIDTGVDLNHPALTAHYRGNDGGTMDHNYNWFDVDGSSPDEPADTDEHGTHVTGTIVGDDGSGNQIGVAPGAKWIATNGCCPSDVALLESMEWVLAPTDLNGENPNTDMRPHIVNNSWGTTLPSNDPFGEELSEAWAEAGIFGVFSNGNLGPECSTSGSPGSRAINYSVGAYDVNNVIGDFSSRGPGADGEIKPNISAPGVNVRSSVPGGGYAEFNGTSMAAPHVSGAIALLWSAVPELQGDVAGTRALLDETAIDVDDTSCGGSADDNNVYGEGRLDALALLEAAAGEQPPAVPVERVQGEHRYQTAAEVAREYADANTVYVTTGQAPYDTLAGSPAAARGVIGTMSTPEGPAPIVLVKADGIPRDTQAVLNEIAPANIVILGSEAAVNGEVETALGEYADSVRRIGGEDRYDTAVNIAREFPTPSKVYVALGNEDYFADALSGSALAGTESAPILLVQTDNVPGVVSEYLAELPDAEVVVLGGESVVSDAVYQEVGAASRLGGEDRFRSSLVISGEFESAEHVYVATGRDYPDALTGAALAGSVNGPLLLVPGSNDNLGQLGADFEAELDRLGPARVVILGGTNAVSQGIQDEITEMVNN